ncbi:acyl-CoA synthetase (AMP-forming)/AMP-acid ligase II [Novosphingobium kunmingense]|uniref:Acyl-CoA synthetase (AMP-forming)/AMP-acid ligase II n=1 Tax=Novosphingobium kunmingense TaxID=1211806 RepID=A0A2N0H5W7_9SPHN|nr:AMP-binding protein [Novosphingobium kunmingense]PKB14333.1 acyl-CoA synthetase (AMP-forming)/AMP-acid ligase II [Novosphingobium kunmingense]
MTIAVGEMPGELEAGWRAAGLWQDRSLAEAMASAARDRPQAPLHFFGADGDRKTTLRQVHEQGLKLAGSFHAMGLRPGDTIAMQLPNGLENAVLFQAAAALGCTLLPIVHIYGPHELGHILADSGAKALIVPDRWRSIDYLDRLARLPALPQLRHRIVMGDAVPEGAIGFGSLPAGTLPHIEATPDALALLLYTSGTTAAPKGVRHTSRSILAELNAQRRDRPSDEYGLSPWPSGHIAGTLAVMGHALLGRPMILLEAWDAALAAKLVDRFKVREMSGTPFHLSGLMEAAERDGFDISSIAQFLIGATTVPPALVAASEAVGIRCCRCYGSTEMPTVSQCNPEDPLDKRLATDGRANPCVEIRIVDDSGSDLPTGTEGEVAVRGAERFAGYTDLALDAASFLPGGWFLTGDIGRLEQDGFLAITDRKKDIIIRGGENVSSREVEELLLQVPGIREAAAIGIPHPRLGEQICAVVLADDGVSPTIADIDRVFRDLGVARQKTPEALVLRRDLPRTPSGKVQKAELRREIAGDLASAEPG